MADDAELGYTLSEDAMRRVAATVIRDERRLRNGPSRRRRNTSPGTFHSALAKTTSSITARSGTTPGSGTATVWERDSSVVAAVTFTDLVGMTIYNPSTAVIATATYIIVTRDRNGDWWATDVVGPQLLGKTDASHAKGASGTVSVWAGTPGSESDTGVNVTAYNRFSAVATTKWVWLNHNGDGFYLVAAECTT